MTIALVATPSTVLPLERALDCPVRRVQLPDVGNVAYYASGTAASGPAVLLLHGVHAAASSREMRSLAEAFGERPVYALDWPGFGASVRQDLRYGPELYENVLVNFIRRVIVPHERPLDVIALSSAGEFAARAALREPWLFRSLSLLSPTGLAEEPRPSPVASVVRQLRRWPRVAELVFRLLTSKISIRYFMSQALTRGVPRGLVEYAHETARQPGARFAPMAFLAGELATQNASETLYQRLRVPTFVLFDNDPTTSFERLASVTRSNPFVRSVRVEGTSGLAHIDEPAIVELQLREFYRSIELVARAEDQDSCAETQRLPSVRPEAHV